MKPEDLKEKIAYPIFLSRAKNNGWDGDWDQFIDHLHLYQSGASDRHSHHTLIAAVMRDADAVLSAISDAGCTIVPNETEAELELLEEVCAIYAKDEDRYLKENGEPYGSIPTECGMKARSAAQRFYDREASASPFSTKEKAHEGN